MTETEYPGNDYSAADGETADLARRSPVLAVLGVLALGVAGWGLAGGPALPDLNAVPWLLVTLGLLAGLALVISGFRRP
ncbi:MAG: hypothetical protein QM658_13295 [Gordonia sp. (in: high G+C Gram-positive bacteria)]